MKRWRQKYLLLSQDKCYHQIKSGTGVDTEDADREWDCNNESIAFSILEHCVYVSLLIENESGEDATVEAYLS